MVTIHSQEIHFGVRGMNRDEVEKTAREEAERYFGSETSGGDPVEVSVEIRVDAIETVNGLVASWKGLATAWVAPKDG